MRVLGISSADKIISVALVDGDKPLLSTTVAGARAEKVMFYIKEAGIKPEDIDGVAVAAGPGSYSGLRGGLAAAKTLAQVLEVPLVSVSTLEAIAYNLIDIEGTIAVILHARSEEYNFALFGAARGKLKRLTDDMVIKAEALEERISRISGEIWVAGDTRVIKDIKPCLPAGRGIKKRNIHFVDGVHSQPYGTNVAQLGLIKFKDGKRDDPLKLAPRYSHQPNIREYKA